MIILGDHHRRTALRRGVGHAQELRTRHPGHPREAGGQDGPCEGKLWRSKWTLWIPVKVKTVEVKLFIPSFHTGAQHPRRSRLQSDRVSLRSFSHQNHLDFGEEEFYEAQWPTAFIQRKAQQGRRKQIRWQQKQILNHWHMMTMNVDRTKIGSSFLSFVQLS